MDYANQGFENRRDLYDDEDFMTNATQRAFNIAEDVLNYAYQGFKIMKDLYDETYGNDVKERSRKGK